jgi:hypothetical protein
LIHGRGQENDNNDGLVSEEELYCTPVKHDADADEKADNGQQETTNGTDSLSASPINTPTVSRPPLVLHESMNLSSRSTSTSKVSTPSSRALSISQKAQGKRSRQEAFADENRAESEILASLAAEKHARKMAEHAQRMVELGIKKQRMDLDATEKRHHAEDRRLAAQHQREREKEAHDLQMFRLRLQYQGAGAAAQQFDNLNAFGVGGGVPVANDAVAQFGNAFGGPVEDVANNEGLFLEPFRR